MKCRASLRAGLRLAVLMTSAVLAFAAQAQSPGDRVALVIGNARYVYAPPLRNAANDARVMAQALRDIGFDVVDGFDLTHDGMEQQIRAFLRKSENARVRLFYYAGHGLQVDGRNYLVPVNTRLEQPGDLNFETIGLDSVLEALDSPSRTNIIILDACRNNPFARTLAYGRGLMPQPGLAGYAHVGAGTLIVFSTAPDKVALDGDGANSPFTRALARHLRTPGLEVRQMLTRVRADVAAETGGAQIPWDNSALLGDVYLAGVGNAGPPRVVAPAADDVMWGAIRDSSVAAVFDAFVNRFPASPHAGAARERADQLRKRAAVAMPPAAAGAQSGNLAGAPINAPIAQIVSAGNGWLVSFSLPEPAIAVSWRVGDSGPFRETGFLDALDQRTHRRVPNPMVHLDGDQDQRATTLWVRYMDAGGATKGPFPIRFDPDEALVRTQRRMLDVGSAYWIQLQRSNGDLMLSYRYLVYGRCAIRQVRIGIDSINPDRPLALPPCDEKNRRDPPASFPSYFKIPPATRMVSAELTYTDGSVSEIKTFRRQQ